MAQVFTMVILYIWLLSETNDSRKEKIQSSMILPNGPIGGLAKKTLRI
ncbi:Uncharacterised protein [Yersinia aleksiciae]|uniref:Uncharacterized protein n=1 Tax=Yersinia aleksiciae TaxID=263819 RepID=A0A0T9UPR4_YERAE|nr:Uncharacterised protein [Yersinia aleksiciae]CNL59521.1 Uncharacterised protein [Yersinia aleksiciae]